MNKKDLEALGCTPIEDLITEDFGTPGTPQRNEFESNCEAFIIGEQLKAERLKAGMTQEQLAAKIGRRKVTSPVSKTGMQTSNYPRCSRYSKVSDEKSALRFCKKRLRRRS